MIGRGLQRNERSKYGGHGMPELSCDPVARSVRAGARIRAAARCKDHLIKYEGRIVVDLKAALERKNGGYLFVKDFCVGNVLSECVDDRCRFVAFGKNGARALPLA